MKDPKALFPFLFASSWLGNLLLTILAFFLAFTHDGPLSPLIFLTVALCILSGNALPITVYLIYVRWREAELQGETAEASVLVREALKRSESVLDRLDEAEGSLAKGILVARQVPDRIRESMEQVEGLAKKLETLELESFTQALKGQSDSVTAVHTSLEQVKAALVELQAAFKDVRKDMKGVPGSIEKLVGQMANKRAGDSTDELDASVGERLDLLFESLESVQDSLDSLLQRVVELKVAATPPPFPTPHQSEPEPEEEDMEEEDLPAGPEVTQEGEGPVAEPEEVMEEVIEVEDEDLVEVLEDDLDAEDEGIEEIDEEIEEEPEIVVEIEDGEPVEAKPPARKRARKNSAQEEMVLGHEPGAESAPTGSSEGKTRLVAHAMIGMYNKLFIRGDEPWLSWDDGQQMELIGIGEFSWTVDDLREPIDVTVLLNDDIAAEEGVFRLEPGKTVRISPRFPKG